MKWAVYRLVVLSFCLGPTLLLFAQQAAVFKSKIDIVELDVRVLDKSGQPIRGLTASDFSVFEDGKLQQVALFEAVDVAEPETPPAAWMAEVTPDVTTNETRVSRLWVVVIDDALIPLDPTVVQNSRKIVRQVIDKVSAEDLVAIVYTGDSKQAQDFTNDRNKLLQTLDRFHPGLARWKNGAGQDQQFWLGSANTVLNVTDTLSAMPHMRKALIWVTPGAPLNPHPVPGAYEDVDIRLKDLTERIFAKAKSANVPIYPIDPCGLMGLKLYINDGNLAVPDEPSSAWVRAMDDMLMTAANTGGRAVVNANDFASGINEIFSENRSYYVLGYYPTNAASDETLRRLQVRVNRDDVEVRTRSSYFAPKPGDGRPKNVNETLVRAMAVPIAVTELPLQATVAPFAIPGKSGLAAVTIALGVRQPIPESAAKERVTATTELRTTAFTTEGDNRGTERQTAKVILRAGAQGDAEYEALSRINLPPGKYRLRLAAFHTESGKIGTVLVDVVVPNFEKEVAAMSGVVIGVRPGHPSAPRDLFADILPVIPSAQRAFTHDDQASALFYLYQNAGKSLVDATVTMRIIDGDNVVVMDEKQTVAVDRFVGAQAKDTISTLPPSASMPVRQANTAPTSLRAAQLNYQIPLAALRAGDYLLTFDVAIGATSLRRDVRFRVEK